MRSRVRISKATEKGTAADDARADGGRHAATVGSATLTIALFLTAALFAVIAGANDGAAILSAMVRVPVMPPGVALLILMTAVGIGPSAIFGTGVATTLARRLVPFHGSAAELAVFVAAIAAIVVVFTLDRLGLPTSLTLALVAAVTGAALGGGFPISGSVLLTIVLSGLLAPVLCAALGLGLGHLMGRVLHGGTVTWRLSMLHRGAFTVQCLAYSANGAQKMLMVFAFALAASSSVPDPWWLAILVSVLFGVGVLISLRRVSKGLAGSILPIRMRHAAVAETSSSLVVIAAGLAGVPLTMSQAVAGSLVGAGTDESPHRVRWAAAAHLASAWLVTFPAALILAGLAEGVLTRL